MIDRSLMQRMRLGCRWAPERACLVPPRLPGVIAPDLGAWARGDVPRVTGHNDVVGDCVPTAAANAAQGALVRDCLPGRISDAYPLSLYSTLTGYRAGSPATDRGTDPDVLFTWWQKNAIAGFRLGSATPLAANDEPRIRRAIRFSGGVFLIVALSVEQQDQTEWRPAGTPGSWGYHAVWADSFDGALTFCTTWGHGMPIDRSYFTAPGFVQAAYDLDLRRAA